MRLAILQNNCDRAPVRRCRHEPCLCRAPFRSDDSPSHMHDTTPSGPRSAPSDLTWNGFHGLVENARAAPAPSGSLTITEDRGFGYHRIIFDLTIGEDHEILTIGFSLRPAGRRS